MGDGLRWVFEAFARFALRPVGRGLRRLFVPVWPWLRAVDVALGDFLRWAARAVGRVLWAVVLVPLAWGWRTLAVRPLRWLWREVVVRCARAVWWVVRLFCRALVWAFRVVGRGLAWAGGVVGDALVWAWRVLARVFRTLVVVPVRWVWRVVVTPIGRVVGRVWRAVVVPPARWVRVSVVEPVRLAGRRLRGAFGGRG
ncbi:MULTISPECIES: hypothetical protein [Saccharothrix]|uniref:hypothetical protein n=1 Tax=Saccharothrix TaxID=2071 RepID=UPI00093C3F7A|nr:hypothetical protein [Saccharothrix sp. CB00851]OKI24969.1 hypothetical protein A6A25_33815 [Saccharothrix sp. CB00851]